jgi:eukaryotic-like serine/threonine-protein kinase
MQDAAQLVGQQIGQYAVREFIARGGMADVYLAYDVELKRKVALKVLLPALAADAQFAQRFQREAQTVARLDHPNIVHVYTIGTTPNGLPYIAMQYIEGGSLRDKLAQLTEQGALTPVDQALKLLRQIADALRVAHDAGIIHRDLKPGTLFLRKQSVFLFD